MARWGRTYPTTPFAKTPPLSQSYIPYDATGAGAQSPGGGSTTLSWSHTITGNAVLVFLSCDNVTSVTASATVGVTAMTQLASVLNYNFSGCAFAFGLLSPPTGAQTITITFSSSSEEACGNSVSYSGVTAFGTPRTRTVGGTPAMTVPSGNGPRIAQMFAGRVTSLTGYNQTQRAIIAGVATRNLPIVIGDAPGSRVVNFALTNASINSAGIAVPLT